MPRGGDLGEGCGRVEIFHIEKRRGEREGRGGRGRGGQGRGHASKSKGKLIRGHHPPLTERLPTLSLWRAHF
jgi:hypothetical protein